MSSSSMSSDATAVVMVPELWISIDMEASGPLHPGTIPASEDGADKSEVSPGNAMLSIGAAAYLPGGPGAWDKTRKVATFKVNLAPPAGSVSDPDTMKWWSENKVMYDRATKDPVAPSLGMKMFEVWCLNLKLEYKVKTLVAIYYPAVFDGGWIDQYLLRFNGSRELFQFNTVDIRSYGRGVLKSLHKDTNKDGLLKRFLSGKKLTHDPVDDAEQQGEMFANLVAHNHGSPTWPFPPPELLA